MWSDESRKAALEARRAKGSHQSGVDKVGKSSVSARVLDVIRQSPTGFTVSPQGNVPTRGYMVSVPGRTRIVSTDDMKGPNGGAIVNDYARKNADALKDPRAHMGAWRDKATGNVHLDVSHNIPRQREAVTAGRTRNQIAIWDVKRKREIRTGGTGDKRP